jgi:translocation and assembly module TamA
MSPRVPVRALAALLLCASACATTGGTGPKIRSFDIEGANQVSANEIQDSIVTSDRFDPNTWQADLRRIERFYQSRGYYNAKVVEQSISTGRRNTVRIKLKVDEGKPTTVSHLEISGMGPLPKEHQDTVISDLPLKPGKVFKEDDWSELKETIAFRLRELGYAQAFADGQAIVDIRKDEARLSVRTVPGSRYKFGPMFIATDPRAQVERKRIVEQAEGSVEAGEWYSDSAMKEAQDRIQSMGVFAAVKVSKGPPDDERGVIPVVVDVREAPFHSVRAGGGFGLDPTRNELRVLGEYTHRNFFGDLRRLTLDGKLGWAFLPNIYDALFNVEAQGRKNGPLASIRLEFEQPHFVFRYVRFVSSIEFERGIEPAYTFYSGRFRAGFIWQPRPRLSLVPTYNAEFYELPEGSPQAVRVLPLGCSSCFLQYLEQRIEWDQRDNPLEPKKGYYAGFAIQEGGGPFATYGYLRMFPDLRGYLTPGDGRLTLAAKVRVGTLIPLWTRGQAPGTPPTSPVVNRFYSGGADMRGFNSRRLSPMVIVPQQRFYVNGELQPNAEGVVEGEALPVGGNGLFEGSLEARYRVGDKLVLALFLDTGFVTEGSLRLDGFKQMQYAVGAGIRYPTVIGPIRVDLAYRLNIGPPLPTQQDIVYKADGTPVPMTFEGTRGCFVGGFSNAGRAGYPEGPCAFHIFIGEAF